ncbi:hypothetical protein [Flammeovirga sp. SJP92]|uniref:hypothetical protein n=1 Tax=Flammeovirga sp. SJP92 TaxID=1775430 RepID=UPI0007869616|nr:hypothetical protein [Flammeovirga sp. SJP92]KXX69821.1 hypothetical protein AVL50_13100 [Flammeovirga sp. SJP92]
MNCKKQFYISLFTLVSLLLFGCDEATKVDVEKNLSTAIEFNEPAFIPDIKKRFGKDVVGVDNIKINSNSKGILLEGKVKLENGKTETRSVTLSNKEMEKIVKNFTKDVALDVNWTIDEEVDINISQSDSSRAKVIKINKTGETAEEKHDHLFKSEIEQAVADEHNEKIKNINSMNVSIDDDKTYIEADVTLENGETVKQVIERSSDDEFKMKEGNNEVKIKMIEIEEK